MFTSKFHELTAIQAAGLFAREAGGTISTIYLSQMMYFLEREIIRKIGRPLFSADMITTRYGISLVQVDKGIQEINTGEMKSTWSKYFYQKGEYEIHLCEDPGEFKISLSNSRLLNKFYQRFCNFTWNELWHYSTQLPEYNKGDIGLPLARKELIKALKISDSELRKRREHYRLL